MISSDIPYLPFCQEDQRKGEISGNIVYILISDIKDIKRRKERCVPDDG